MEASGNKGAREARDQLVSRVESGPRMSLERAVRDSDEFFRIAFEQSLTGIAIVRLSDGKFAYVNQAMCDFLGYSQGELLTKDIISLSHAENVPPSRAFLDRLATGEFNGEHLERRYARKDGSVVWALVSFSLMRDEEGRYTYVASQLKNITKRKEAEAGHQRAEVFAHAIMENIDDLVMVISAETKWYYASPSHLEGLGYAPSELIGQNAFFTLHEGDRPLVEQAVQTTLSSGRAPLISVRRLHKSGSVRHFEARGTLVRGLCDGKDGIVVVSRAIDDRLLAEQKLREASAETELFLRSIPSILIGLDAEGRITRWNRSAADVFHLSSDQVLGLSIDDCGVKWLSREMGFEVSRWLQSKTAYRCEDLAYEVNQERRYVGFAVRRIECDGSQQRRFILTGADVTDRKNLEQQLRQAQKLEAIGQLAAGIAHEINTPTQFVGDNTRFVKDSWQGIANLLQLSQTMRQQAETGLVAREVLEKFDRLATDADLEYSLQEVPRALDQSLDGVQRVAKIVKAMKDFSHLGSQEKKATDINRAIESTVAVARHEWKYVAEVVLDLENDLPLVPCLSGEFNQVILNLHQCGSCHCRCLCPRCTGKRHDHGAKPAP